MEKIKTIEVKNFKSLKHVVIDDCRRVNVFIGYPNVGKSNILEAISLFSLADLVKGDLEYYKNRSQITNLSQICRVKNDYEFFYNQDIKETITVKLNSNFFVDLYKSDNELNIDFLKFRFNQGNLRRIILADLTIDNKFNLLGEKRRLNLSIDETELLPPVKKYEFTNTEAKKSDDNHSTLSSPFGDNLSTIFQINSEIRSAVYELFKSYGLRFAIDNANQEIRLLKELDNDTIVIIPYHQIADTLKRLIFFKAAIYSNRDSVLLFEEPEAHMFPPYISKFTSDVALDKNNNQYFISTHSPFVLNDFMEELESDDLAIYVVGYSNGETTVNRLTDEQVTNVYQYGVDLFFNLEEFLKDGVAQ